VKGVTDVLSGEFPGWTEEDHDNFESEAVFPTGIRTDSLPNKSRKNLTVWPRALFYVFRMVLIVNSDCFPKQH
jgi:hypothetical protein